MSTSTQGVIVMLSDGRARHFPGTEGLRDARDYARAHGLQVCVLSTPETILRDLRGSRAREQAKVAGTKYPKHGDLLPYDPPEDKMLRGVGALDLFQRPEVAVRWWPLRLRQFRRRPDYPRRGNT